MTDDASTNTSTTRPLTPSAAAARKRPTQDRKPKTTRSKPKAREEIDLSVSRDTVDVGFDFRPLPMRMGPGDDHLWLFNPDPDVSAWAAVSKAVDDLASRGGADVSMDELADLVTQIREALADVLYDPETDRDRFLAERRYGPMALSKLAQKLMEEVTGFPTQP